MASKTICVICGEGKSARSMSKHRNNNLNENFGFCKSCLNDVTSDNNVEVVIDLLRMMDIPFVEFVWENALEKGGETVFSKYLQLVATQKKYVDFSDSQYGDAIEEDVAIDITDDVIEKWGVRDSREEYVELEYMYNSLTKIKEPSTVFEQRRYIQNVKLGKAIDEVLESGDFKLISQLRKAYSDDLKDLGLDVKQSADDNKLTLGMRIAEWEKNAPIPDNSEFDDVDHIQKYVTKWFLTPMKRVFGRASEEEINSLYE